MFNPWVVLLAVAGVSCVVGNQCDTEEASACYDVLEQYETKEFPLYGGNEAILDDTCGNINMSVHCIGSYVDTCLDTEECDENCAKFIKLIHGFLSITGLLKLHDNLCDKGNVLRQRKLSDTQRINASSSTMAFILNFNSKALEMYHNFVSAYLESAECLEETTDLYAVCHNVSLESRNYMDSTEGANTVEAHCCYLSWYRDCFTNATSTHCGENATIAISIMAQFLLGEISDKLCSRDPVFCDAPPLPTDKPPIDNEIDKTDNEMDKQKLDETNNEIDDHEIDNKPTEPQNTTDDSKNAATTLYASTVIVLPYVFSILFNYVL